MLTDDRRWLWLTCGAVLLAMAGAAQGATRGATRASAPVGPWPAEGSKGQGPSDGTFAVIGIPDTQNYSEFYPEIYRAQMQWIADQKGARNIRFASHYGDIVNHGDRENEWANARSAMRILEQSGIPHGVTAGNHDITPSGTAGTSYIPQKYLENFGPQRYSGMDWYGGASPSGMSNFQIFNGGGRQFLAFHLVCDAPVEELAWAQGVIAKNRDKAVMVTTHRYLQDAEDYTGGVPVVASGRYPSVWYGVEGTYHPQGIQSDEIFDWFIRRNKNIFMVNCGHFHEEYRQTSANAWGLPVHEVLADYQDDPNGGDGWLRIMNFDVARKRIDVESYSPTRNEFRTADESRFSLGVDFDSYVRSGTSLTFQNGINGYQGTLDTWINEGSAGTSYGAAQTFDVDDDTGNSIFNDRRGQALLRFEGMIGEAPEQIPAGAVITEATLRLQFSDDVDFLYDADFDVYMAGRDWNESSTWNSLGNGLSGAELGLYLGRLEGDNNPDSDFMRMLDVRAAVQAWVNGAANFGFAILPEVISGNDDGITVWSSEASNILFRPVLDVTYTLAGTTLAREVPGPGAGGLMMLAGLACVRRRRA
ncbi:MAG: DNRLRE domain-containing protein [Planctomycetota bacterium]|nr:DNRLRE domain-containing protein [Planctomycetota bacterium]